MAVLHMLKNGRADIYKTICGGCYVKSGRERVRSQVKRKGWTSRVSQLSAASRLAHETHSRGLKYVALNPHSRVLPVPARGSKK